MNRSRCQETQHIHKKGVFERKGSYRIYTPVWINGKLVCAGVDVHSIGKDINVSDIKTVFLRDIEKIGKGGVEELVYPENEDKLRKALEEPSPAHNSLVYPQEPDAKIGKKEIRSEQNTEKITKKLQTPQNQTLTM